MENIDLLHQVDLEIVKAVVELCERHQLRYYMLGGTMLGAIRHKGFIPWDDDVDLGMPREDYEKFLALAPQELPQVMKVVNYRNTPEYQYYITRILHTQTKVEEERIGNQNRYTCASIDIFPLDGTPNGKLARRIYVLRVLYHRALMSLCYKDSIDRKRKRGAAERLFLWCMERVPVEKLTTPYRQKCKIDKLLRSQDVETSRYIGNLMGAYRAREIMPRDFFGQGTCYPFEDMQLRGPEMYDAYLTHMYGDYMTIPAPEQRKTHFKIREIRGKKVE